MTTIFSSKRACSICGCRTGSQLLREEWPVVGIGTVEVGICVCEKCGFVFQSPVIDPPRLQKYYRETSNYTNPGRSGRPSEKKIQAVDRQLRMLHRCTCRRGSALQIGSSDGYTLHRLKSSGWNVSGVDPSPEASQLASSLWDVHVEVGFFEEWAENHDHQYDLIVLTHILEHLYDPVKVLVKSRELLHDQGFVLVEIPVLEKPETWPPGYFTLEHLNYFSKASLMAGLCRAGFKLMNNGLSVTTKEVEYPVLTCVGQASQDSMETGEGWGMSSQQEIELVTEYLKREAKLWDELDHRLSIISNRIEHAVVWCAGIHTSQLLARTKLERYTKIDFLVDSDSNKWGLELGPYKVLSPEEIDFADPSLGIVISSFESEREILKSLVGRSPRASIVPLYNKI